MIRPVPSAEWGQLTLCTVIGKFLLKFRKSYAGFCNCCRHASFFGQAEAIALL